MKTTAKIMKKITITTAVIVLGTAGIANAAPDSNSILRNGIEYYIQTDKSLYRLGEHVEMLYRITNLRDEDVTFGTPHTPPWNFWVQKDANDIWRAVNGWYAMPTIFTLGPGDSKQFPTFDPPCIWNMRDDENNLVNLGEYTVIGGLYAGSGYYDYTKVAVSIEIIPSTRLVPDEYPTIQAAIDAAVDGDTVLVADGTYTGPGNRDIDFLGKAITVRSESGPENCIIDCNGTESDPHRGFYFHNREDAKSSLEGFTITKGEASYGGGGGIACYGYSSPTITNCIINANSAYEGGGIYCSRQSHPTITNCTITSNLADFGGGIDCYGSSPTITNCIISGNTAEWNGGGISCSSSSPTITNCTINGNSTAYGSGGGIYCQDSTPTITNCIISGNSTGYGGGGIFCDDSNVVITNCTISGNSAKRYGGGICCQGSNLNIINCIISGNIAEAILSRAGWGGGIYCEGGSLAIINCTISSNWADEHGGGIYCYRSSPTITNCILWDNLSEQIYGHPSIAYSDIQQQDEWEWWDYEGNISADPCFVEPGYWADANNPNIIVEPNNPNAIWVDGDYHLKSEGWRWDAQRKVWVWDDVTSRCIDAGNPSSPVGEELLTIPVDPNNEWGENLRINMGVYGGTAEASMAPFNWALLADLTNDGTVNFEDYAAQTIDWLESKSEQPGDLNHNGTVDIADLALLTEDWLKQTSWYVP